MFETYVSVDGGGFLNSEHSFARNTTTPNVWYMACSHVADSAVIVLAGRLEVFGPEDYLVFEFEFPLRRIEFVTVHTLDDWEGYEIQWHSWAWQVLVAKASPAQHKKALRAFTVGERRKIFVRPHLLTCDPAVRTVYIHCALSLALRK